MNCYLWVLITSISVFQGMVHSRTIFGHKQPDDEEHGYFSDGCCNVKNATAHRELEESLRGSMYECSDEMERYINVLMKMNVYVLSFKASIPVEVACPDHCLGKKLAIVSYQNLLLDIELQLTVLIKFNDRCVFEGRRKQQSRCRKLSIYCNESNGHRRLPKGGRQ